MYSSIAHSCTNSTVVAGYHDSRRNTDTPYRSLWRYICSSCARAGVFPGIPVCPVYRFFLVLPLQAGKSGHRLYRQLLPIMTTPDFFHNLFTMYFLSIIRQAYYYIVIEKRLLSYYQYSCRLLRIIEGVNY